MSWATSAPPSVSSCGCSCASRHGGCRRASCCCHATNASCARHEHPSARVYGQEPLQAAWRPTGSHGHSAGQRGEGRDRQVDPLPGHRDLLLFRPFHCEAVDSWIRAVTNPNSAVDSRFGQGCTGSNEPNAPATSPADSRTETGDKPPGLRHDAQPGAECRRVAPTGDSAPAWSGRSEHRSRQRRAAQVQSSHDCPLSVWPLPRTTVDASKPGNRSTGVCSMQSGTILPEAHVGVTAAAGWAGGGSEGGLEDGRTGGPDSTNTGGNDQQEGHCRTNAPYGCQGSSLPVDLSAASSRSPQANSRPAGDRGKSAARRDVSIGDCGGVPPLVA